MDKYQKTQHTDSWHDIMCRLSDIITISCCLNTYTRHVIQQFT